MTIKIGLEALKLLAVLPDTCTTMTSTKCGAIRELKKLVPGIFYVPCFNQNTKLSLLKSFNSTWKIRIAIDTASDIVSFFS